MKEKMKYKQIFIIFILCLSLVPNILPNLTVIAQNPEFEESPNTIAEVGEEINWSRFWIKFKQYSLWDLEWYNGFEWLSVQEDLDVQLSFPEPNIRKVNLVFDASHSGNYRLTFAINRVVKDHVKKIDKYQYELTYENMTIIFDWSDCAEINGIQFSHGIQNEYFWFRIRRDNVPLGAHIEIDPATVATSTARDTINDVYQRKGFHAAGRHWAFYADGTNAVYESSTDGTTWSGSATSIGACDFGIGWGFSVWFDGTYIHYARYQSSGQILFYRRGTPINDGSITWSAVEQTVHDGDGSNNHRFPTIAVDSSGYAWIGTEYDAGANESPYVLKNANNDGTWSTEFSYRLNTTDQDWRVQPVPLTSDKVYVIYGARDNPLYGNLYNAGWGGEETNLGDYPVETEGQFSAVAIGDNVHLAYNRLTTNQFLYNNRTFGVGWLANDVLVQSGTDGNSAPVLTADPSLNETYLFWTNVTTDHVYYRIHDGSSWGSSVDWIDESTDDIQFQNMLTSSYQDYDGFIGLLYTTKTGSPYNVRFAYLSDNPPTITSASITDLDDVDNVYEMKRYYTFQVVVDDTEGANTITNVSLRILNGNAVLAEVIAATLTAIPAYSIVSNATEIDLDSASCSWGVSGTTGTVTFKIRFEWDFTDIADLELSVFATDEDGNTVGWTVKQTDYFDVIGRLVTSGLASNVTFVSTGGGVQITGTVYYATTVSGDTASSSYPLDAQFTATHVHNTTHNTQGNDTSITNGAFSVDITAPSTVGTFAYHIYLDLVADYVDADAPDGDTVSITTINSVLIMSFDDETGTTTEDISDSNNDGTLFGATREDSGLYGRGITFDGINDYIQVSESASLNITQNISLFAWINTGDPDVQGIIIKDGAYELSVISNYAIRLTINSTNLDTVPNVFTANIWTFITGVYNSSHMLIYINSTLIASQSTTGVIATNENDLFLGNNTGFFNGTLDELRILNYALSLTDIVGLMWAPIASFPYSLDATIIDMEAENWIFVDGQYDFTGRFVRKNASNTMDTVQMRFNDGVFWTTLILDLITDTETLSSAGAYLIRYSDSLSGNVYSVTWELYIADTIYDSLDVDIYMETNNTDAEVDSFAIVEPDFFNIYNRGGLTQTKTVGDGYILPGEGVFGLAATNVTKSAFGSSAYANVTWRNLQHVGMIVHLFQDTGWDAGNGYWECPTEHENTGYIEYGINFWANDTLITGWRVHIEIDDGNAGTHGVGTNHAWVKLNVTWYNEDVLIKSDLIYAYYEAIKADDITTQFALYIDLWFGDIGGSSVVNGRVRPQYYGMNETGWGPWASWSPIYGLTDESSFQDDLNDENSNVISASQVELMSVWALLNKTALDADSPTDDNHRWELKDYTYVWRTIPVTELMYGITPPPETPTVDPDDVTPFFAPATFGMWSELLAPTFTLTARVPFFFFSAMIDSAFRFFKITGFVNAASGMVQGFATYFIGSMTTITALMIQYFRIIDGVAQTMLSWTTQMVTFFILLSTIFQGILDGTASVSTGIGNVWDFMDFNEWSAVLPLIIFLVWIQTVDDRHKRAGGGWLHFMWGDVQIGLSMVSFVLDSSFKLYQVTIDMVFRLMDAIPKGIRGIGALLSRG